MTIPLPVDPAVPEDGPGETSVPAVVGGGECVGDHVGGGEGAGGSRPPKRRGKLVAIVAAIVAVVILGVGGVVVVSKLKSSGSQPDTVIPADAWLYTRVDLDPSAGQKIGAVRLLGKLPSTGDLISGKRDPVSWAFQGLQKVMPCLSDQSYDQNITPWVGQRAAIALRAGTDKGPAVVYALAVTDEQRAKDWFDRTGKSCSLGRNLPIGLEATTRDGYLIVLQDQHADEYAAALDKGSLATNARYTGDVAALGEMGIWSIWLDSESFLSQAKDRGWFKNGSVDTGSIRGRVAAAIRFNPDFVELAGVVRGLDLPEALTSPGTPNTVNLPGDTTAVLAVAKPAKMLEQSWPEIKQSIERQGLTVASAGQQLGMNLPDDLYLIFGDQLTASLGRLDVFGKKLPFAVRTVTTDGSKATSILDRVLSLAGSSASAVNLSTQGNDLLVSNDSAYAQSLDGHGDLGTKDSFTLAVADSQRVSSSMYIDIDAFEGFYLGSVNETWRGFVEAMRSFGVSVRATAPDEARFAIRLVGN